MENNNKNSSDLKVDFSLVILAGGKSSRMQFPKAFLQCGQETFSQKISHLYSSFVHRKIIVLNSKIYTPQWIEEIQRLRDSMIQIILIAPNCERFHTLRLGMMNISSEKCFIHPVDNPLITENIISKMSAFEFEKGVLIPVFKGRKGHPVLIGKDIIQAIKKETDETIPLNCFLDRFQKHYIEVQDDSILTNINTPEEYNKYFHCEPNTITSNVGFY